MTTYFRSKSGTTYRLTAMEALARQLDWLVALLTSIEAERGTGFLKPGVKIQVGWSVLTVVETAEGYAIGEPDFFADPFHDLRNDLSVTLCGLAEQNTVLQKLGLDGMPSRFDEKIAVADGCLQERRVYLERTTPATGSTGWYIGSAGEIWERPVRGPETLFVYELLRIRPALLKVLALPARYLAVFDHDRIEAILNERDEKVW